MTEDIDDAEGDGGPDRADRPHVLVVDDEADVRELYADLLAAEYAVSTAASGPEALDVLDDSVDVVLLDRRMPGLHGDDTLDRIRASSVDVRVAAVTGVAAGIDVVGLAVDAYLEKPVAIDDLRETVDRLVRVARYDDRVRQYFAVMQKQAALEDAGVGPVDGEYGELAHRRETLKAGLDDLRARLDPEDYEILFRDLDTPGHESPADLYA
ncbi:response regulator [Halobaculum gomorrense]|uniref:HalX domain-containing protein n=1 Tax=Halobaculum gomorrense TaxID=43928 RepID=A0A1M5T101_9EURY|nr:response regulator [Halobaculum gomorrense]SHH44439.1 HalX domain-containing protein [Halobaculum gomorrense]